jgi:EmrB/QacA subfamily drug resistance transporter
MTTTTAGRAGRLRGNPWAVLTLASLGYFMTLLDLTIVNIAIPNMITRLSASLDDVLWVLNAYALVLAVLVITCGRLGDRLGPRAMFTAGIAVFTAASAACGFAPSAGWLIAFRAVQGTGAAMLMPQTLAMVTIVFPPGRRGAAFGVWGAVTGLATIAGPVLGGLLVTAFGWRWIFFINLPVGLAVLAATPAIIPELRTGLRHRMDLRGVALASIALLAICYGLVEGQHYNWGTVSGFITIPLIFGTGAVFLAAFLIDQARRQHGGNEPLLPFELFRDRNFTLMNWTSAALSVGMLGVFLGFTIYLQSVLGFSAIKAGLTLLPSSLVSVIAAPAAGKLTDRIGGKYLLLSGLACFAAGTGWAVLAAGTGSAWDTFLPSMSLLGLGIGLVFAPLTTIAMSRVPERLAGAASGTLNTMRQVGSVAGTAAVGALLQNRLVSSLTSQATAHATTLPATARAPFVDGFRQTAASGTLAAGSGTQLKLPAGTSPALAHELARLAGIVFANGYVDAMRWTMILPVAVVALAALTAFALRNDRPAKDGPGGEARAADPDRVDRREAGADAVAVHTDI